jgi:2-dehydro-3-deoxy-D-arabinonate dehydratase
MKLCQFFVPERGKRVGVVQDAAGPVGSKVGPVGSKYGPVVIDITSPKAGVTSVLDLIVKGGSSLKVERLAQELVKTSRIRYDWKDLDRAPSPRRPHLLAPLDPPEVWGAGITYRRSREYYAEHEGHAGRTKGIYDYVYEAKRPELFFKATASRTVGPNGAIGIRSDSSLTAVEPELAVVIGARGRIIGYSAANDCSAWDIERENPLFLPQSKIFTGCFALGPVLTTAGEIRDAHVLNLVCSISRGGAEVYRGRVNTRELKRRCPELVEWLCRDNAIPPGTVLSTGTGILVPDEHALADGDVVEIELDGVGTLRNHARKLRP